MIDRQQERDGGRQDPGCLKGRIMKCSSRSGDSKKKHGSKDDLNNRMESGILHEVGTYYLLEKTKLFWLYAVPHNKHGIDLLKWKANML